MQALGKGGPPKLHFELEPIWFIEQLLLHTLFQRATSVSADILHLKRSIYQARNCQDNSINCVIFSLLAPTGALYDMMQHVRAYLRPCFRFASSSNDAGCTWLDGRSASDFLRKAGRCNFLVANPTNQLFTAFHRDVISYRPTACYASFKAWKQKTCPTWMDKEEEPNLFW